MRGGDTSGVDTAGDVKDDIAGSVGNDVDDVDALRDRGELNAVTLAAGAPRISMAGWRC